MIKFNKIIYAMNTRIRVLLLALIIPFLSLINNLLFTNDKAPLNLIHSISGAVGTSVGFMLGILAFNAIVNFILNRKFQIRISNVNFIIYSILIIALYIVTNVLIPA
jgi:hypothetical protein